MYASASAGFQPGEPAWSTWRRFDSMQLPPATRHWLLDEGSLTARLSRPLAATASRARAGAAHGSGRAPPSGARWASARTSTRWCARCCSSAPANRGCLRAASCPRHPARRVCATCAASASARWARCCSPAAGCGANAFEVARVRPGHRILPASAGGRRRGVGPALGVPGCTARRCWSRRCSCRPVGWARYNPAPASLTGQPAPCELRARLPLYLRLIRFDRPIGSFLLLWPTLWGLWLRRKGRPSLVNLLIFSAGVFLMRSAGCVAERFRRPRFRPPCRAHARTARWRAGELGVREALAVCALLALAPSGWC